MKRWKDQRREVSRGGHEAQIGDRAQRSAERTQ